MGFLFSKKERHEIDGREIIIVDKSKAQAELKKKFKDEILRVCSFNDMAKRFTKITFVLVGKIPKEISDYKKFNEKIELGGWVYNSVEINNPKIFLDIRTYVKELPYLDLLKFGKTIVHELTHVCHNVTSRALLNQNILIKKSLKKTPRNIISPKNDDIYFLKQELISFINKVNSEGLAEFFKELADDLVFTSKIFDSTYGIAKLKTHKILDNWEQFYDLKEYELSGGRKLKKKKELKKWLEKYLKKYTYDVGFHIVYAIIWADHNFNGNDLEKMSVYYFIKKYELSMAKLGLQPLISYNSGKGVFDFNKALGELDYLYKKTKRKYRKFR
jgi:hypothetical protein